MSTEKLSEAEMRLFVLGAALYGANMEGSRIIANALDEMQRLKRKAKKPKRRGKK